MAFLRHSQALRHSLRHIIHGGVTALLMGTLYASSASAIENDGPPFKFVPTTATRYYKITSLSDSGRGTLRECAAATGSRVCLFEVGGVIELRSDIVIKSQDIFIAGQTAPYPGITLTRAGISVRARDVQIEHIAIRPGDSTVGSDPSERNGVAVGAESVSGVYNVSLKNLSLTWAVDENFSTWYPTTRDIWLQNSIVAEGLYNSIHPKGTHSDGVLIGDETKKITLQGNLVAFNYDRNPYVKPGSSAKLMNNFVYGWGEGGPWDICNLTNNEGNQIPVIGAFMSNIWMPAPYSYQADGSIYSGIIAPGSEVYVTDNFGPGRWSSALPDSAITNLADPNALTTTCPFATGCTAPLLASDTEAYVLKNSGSRPKQRSSIDVRIVDDVKNRTGSIKDCLTGCARATGGIPPTRRTRRNLTVPRNPTGDSNGNGVSNFDEWILIYTTQVAYV